MKKMVILGCVVILASCNNSATVTIGNDTIGRKVDTVGSKAERLLDTASADLKEAGKNIRNKVKEGLDKVEVNIKTDTTHKHK
jgi:hypothetical protein